MYTPKLTRVARRAFSSDPAFTRLKEGSAQLYRLTISLNYIVRRFALFVIRRSCAVLFAYNFNFVIGVIVMVIAVEARWR